MLLLVHAALPSSAAACVGDCGGDGRVTVDELMLCVGIALGAHPTDACLAGDIDHDGTMTIAEVVTAVDNAMTGCPPPALNLCMGGLLGDCPPGNICACCCGVYRCVALGTACCALACPPF